MVALEAREVEHLVDELQEVPSARAQALDVAALRVSERSAACRGEEVGVTEGRIDGCAHLPGRLGSPARRTVRKPALPSRSIGQGCSCRVPHREHPTLP